MCPEEVSFSPLYDPSTATHKELKSIFHALISIATKKEREPIEAQHKQGNQISQVK